MKPFVPLYPRPSTQWPRPTAMMRVRSISATVLFPPRNPTSPITMMLPLASRQDLPAQQAGVWPRLQRLGIARSSPSCWETIPAAKTSVGWMRARFWITALPSLCSILRRKLKTHRCKQSCPVIASHLYSRPFCRTAKSITRQPVIWQMPSTQKALS